MLDLILPGLLIFIIGIIGIIISRKNVVIVLMSIEVMLVGVNLMYILYGVYLDDIMGQIMSIYILTIAAAEAAIGLAILVLYYRIRGVIEVNLIQSLKG